MNDNMSQSTPQFLSTPIPPALPSQRPVFPPAFFLRDFLNCFPDAAILRHFLGTRFLVFPPILDLASIVSLDVKWWAKDPSRTLELGIAELPLFAHCAMMQPQAPHAYNILEKLRASHARIMPNAHLTNQKEGSGDPEKFHFGTSRFVTQDEAKEVLEATFLRSFATDMSQCGIDTQPIILVGHGLKRKKKAEHLEKVYGIDIYNHAAIVKVIDTQDLAYAAGLRTRSGKGSSLEGLLRHFHIEPENTKMAGNDAAFTLVVAVLLSLGSGVHETVSEKLELEYPAVSEGTHIQEVIEHVIGESKNAEPPTWGREKFCTRCDQIGHTAKHCQNKNVQCSKCRQLNMSGWDTHKAGKCIFSDDTGISSSTSGKSN